MLKSFKQEVNIFFVALMFYSRLPCPKWLKLALEHFLEEEKQKMKIII